MVKVRTDVRPEEVRQSARHVLFVEGSGPNPLDSDIVRELLGKRIQTEPLVCRLSWKWNGSPFS